MAKHRPFTTLIMSTVMWVLLVAGLSSSSETDISCLMSIKSQLHDPNGHLSDWVFNNETENFICAFNGVTCWTPDNDDILEIALSGLGLEGEFPRGMNQCSNLQLLDLSRNNLSGTLPPDISINPFLASLDLSFNLFSGEIPTNLSGLTFLDTLMLNDNRFTGQIPPQLAWLQRLTRFSVANNHLTGPVPNFSEPNVSAYANNAGLCGFPLDPCSDSSSKVDIIGAVVGAVIFAPIGAGYGWICFRREERPMQRRR
ncbi:PREDICTED: probably inactive leucine-rich repeat receptor-like protein kinase At5g48380 [Tarenaya hassleriana]|uniref:probably inactive leucine-rich repeat receptor-like protein kinase At5g48380 n=1 Tax=Tarenaya hassleriana TaxID=28532 RepID=UPI00053C9109|nr:PREDICTED: probably inactive leucine-rich repeat receptor-like protein kinase At5g48380 [Tarenaya hassleriana]